MSKEKKKLKLKWWGVIAAGAGVIAVCFTYKQLYDALREGMPRLANIVASPSLPVILTIFLVIVIFAGLIMFKNYVRPILGQKAKRVVYYAPVVIVLLTAYFVLILILPATEGGLFLVYDDPDVQPRPPSELNVDGLEVRRVSSEDLPKLVEIGDVKPSSVLMSLVAQPTRSLGQFLNGTQLTFFSLREVLDEQRPQLHDISGCSFDEELVAYFESLPTLPSRVVILFERDYAAAEKLMSGSLKRDLNIRTTSIVFEGTASLKSVNLEAKECAVFLGSAAQLSLLRSRPKAFDTGKVIAPSWLRPDLIPVSNKSTSSTQDYVAKAICVTPEHYNLLMESDYKSWHSLLSIVESTRKRSDRRVSKELEQALTKWAEDRKNRTSNLKEVCVQ